MPTDINLEQHYMHRPVYDLTALKDIDVNLIDNGLIVEVATLGKYTFDALSSETADNLNIVESSTGPGRWKLRDTKYFKMTADGQKISKEVLEVAGSGGSTIVHFYLDDEVIVPGSSENSLQIHTLTKQPNTSVAEVIDSVTITSETQPIEAYKYNTAIGGDQIEPGTWDFETYARVSSTAGNTNIYTSIYACHPSDGVTLEVTGTGTTRTVITSAPIFVSTDREPAKQLTSFVETPKGLYRILQFYSTQSVDIEVPAGYVNELAVEFEIWRNYFSNTSPKITSTSFSWLSNPNAQGVPGAIDPQTKLGAIYWATTDSAAATTVYYTHNGNEHYSHFGAPLIFRHNDLGGKQGGVNGEFFHISGKEKSKIAQNMCRTCSTGNINIINDLHTGDNLNGVLLDQGMLVLIAFQTDQKENGVYYVNGIGDAPTRVFYLNESGDTVYVDIGRMPFTVEEGSLYAGAIFQCNNFAPVYGTDNITFSRIDNRKDVVSVSSTTHVAQIETRIFCNAAFNNITVNLPDVTTVSGSIYIFKSSSENKVILTPAAGQFINGYSTLDVESINSALTLRVVDGSNWWSIE